MGAYNHEVFADRNGKLENTETRERKRERERERERTPKTEVIGLLTTSILE